MNGITGTIDISDLEKNIKAVNTSISLVKYYCTYYSNETLPIHIAFKILNAMYIGFYNLFVCLYGGGLYTKVYIGHYTIYYEPKECDYSIYRFTSATTPAKGLAFDRSGPKANTYPRIRHQVEIDLIYKIQNELIECYNILSTIPGFKENLDGFIPNIEKEMQDDIWNRYEMYTKSVKGYDYAHKEFTL
jgi:hypothetical protein